MTHIRTFPTLYKRTSNGSIEMWSISVQVPDGTVYGALCYSHGLVGGKQQSGQDVITEGKNAGKANATTAIAQAVAEAQARWTKQKKKGYVESRDAAEAGETDDLIEGGVIPMTAKTYPDAKKGLTWPLYVQPKLDGQRCIAIVPATGEVELWTRSRKRILSVPHVAKAVRAQFAGPIILDGELYIHGTMDFEDLMSAVRKPRPTPESAAAEYWIYDVVDPDKTFEQRAAHGIKMTSEGTQPSPIKLVPTSLVASESLLQSYHDAYVANGYEGTILRNKAGKYKSKSSRSDDLQKYKDWKDAEYEIVDAQEGRGKDAGTVGAFLCRTSEGKEFACRLKATYAHRRALWEDPTQWRGMKLTVKYQNLTADGIPRFPIGKALRKSNE